MLARRIFYMMLTIDSVLVFFVASVTITVTLMMILFKKYRFYMAICCSFMWLCWGCWFLYGILNADVYIYSEKLYLFFIPLGYIFFLMGVAQLFIVVICLFIEYLRKRNKLS